MFHNNNDPQLLINILFLFLYFVKRLINILISQHRVSKYP